MYGFVSIVTRAAPRAIEIDCVCRPSVSGDERTLIAVLSLVQQERWTAALGLLRMVVDPRAALAALDCAHRLMASLTAAGWFLAPRMAGFHDCGQAAPTPILH